MSDQTLARTIWHTSRADEGTISATGANHVATAVLDLLTSDRMREVVARAIRAISGHGFTYSDRGGICPTCEHVYFEKPPGAYMEPDLDWLDGAIAEHRATAALAAIRTELEGASDE